MAGAQGAEKGGEGMTVNACLRGALSGLGLEVLPEVDEQHRERCFTFNYDMVPAQFADNRPMWYRCLVQVHLFLPLKENSVKLRQGAAAALFSAGFTWPEVVDASDEEAQHYVFETETITKLEE